MIGICMYVLWFVRKHHQRMNPGTRARHTASTVERLERPSARAVSIEARRSASGILRDRFAPVSSAHLYPFLLLKLDSIVSVLSAVAHHRV